MDVVAGTVGYRSRGDADVLPPGAPPERDASTTALADARQASRVRSPSSSHFSTWGWASAIALSKAAWASLA